MRRLTLLIALALFLATSIDAQYSDTILRELLDLPSPPRMGKTEDDGNEKALRRPEEFYNADRVPSDDAPIEDVLDYWRRAAARSFFDRKPTISKRNAERILVSCAEKPETLSSYLSILPKSKETGDTVEAIFDKAFTSGSNDVSEGKEVREWLKHNTRKYFDELVADATKARDQRSYGSVTKSEELTAFAQLDPEAAKPLLERLVQDRSNPRTSALALSLLYKNSIQSDDKSNIDDLRDQLKAIVEDKTAFGFSRDAASDVLFSTQWPGQDEWYISLFEDATLLKSTDQNTLYSPISTLASKDPKKWVPILTKLLESKNPSVRNSAVSSLMEIETKESIQPLIPWLSDPNWAEINWSPGGRTTLMQVVTKFDLRESIPGLIWIIENDDDEIRWAARSLGEFKDPRAGPPLKNSLRRVNQESDRTMIIAAVLACEGLTIEEQMLSLEAIAKLSLNPEEMEKLRKRSDYSDENPLPITISIGKYLSEQTEPSAELARAAIARQKVLRKENPSLATAFSQILTKWQGRVIDIELLERLENGNADSESIVAALARRKELRGTQKDELYALRGKSGLPGAIASCMIEDEADVRSAFLSNDREKQIGAMACARLLRLPLPISDAGALLSSSDKLLSTAAERYLESEDSPDARNLVLARYPNEARILGARSAYVPAKISFEPNNEFSSNLWKLFASVGMNWGYSGDVGSLEKSEKLFKDELISQPDLLHVYALIPSGGVGKRIVRVFKDRATFTYEEDGARYKEMAVSKEELNKFYERMATFDLENFFPVHVPCHHNCYSREFLTVSRSGGRRIYSGSGMGALGPLDFIEVLFDRGKFKTYYHFQKSIPGIEVLIDDPKLKPELMWKKGDDFRILISDGIKEDQIDDELRKLNDLDDENEDLDYEEKEKRRFERKVQREFEHYEWREFKNGKLGGTVSEPLEIPFLRNGMSYPSSPEMDNSTAMRQSIWNGFRIQSKRQSDSGLWKVNRAGETEIAKGWFGNEIVVAGNWAVVAKTDTNWADPNYTVRIDLRSGKTIKVAISPAETLYPVAYLDDHKKVLVYRGSEDFSTLNPSKTEFFLLDAETGKVETAVGEFLPFFAHANRRLQPTGKPNEYWATVYSRARNVTEIGRYDAKMFEFKPLLRLPEIVVASDEMWVDEAASKIYIIYSAQYGQSTSLFSVPLPRTPLR